MIKLLEKKIVLEKSGKTLLAGKVTEIIFKAVLTFFKRLIKEMRFAKNQNHGKFSIRLLWRKNTSKEVQKAFSTTFFFYFIEKVILTTLIESTK